MASKSLEELLAEFPDTSAEEDSSSSSEEEDFVESGLNFDSKKKARTVDYEDIEENEGCQIAPDIVSRVWEHEPFGYSDSEYYEEVASSSSENDWPAPLDDDWLPPREEKSDFNRIKALMPEMGDEMVAVLTLLYSTIRVRYFSFRAPPTEENFNAAFGLTLRITLQFVFSLWLAQIAYWLLMALLAYLLGHAIRYYSFFPY